MSLGKDNYRQCRLNFNICDKTSSDEENRDPFKSSGNENDPDYQLPKKPRGQKSHVRKVKAKSNARKANSDAVKKRLTPQERLARLKQKIALRNSTTQNDSTAVSSNLIRFDSQIDKNKENGNNRSTMETHQVPPRATSTPTPAATSFDNHDHLFDDVQIGHGGSKICSYSWEKEPEKIGIPLKNESSSETIGVIFEIRDFIVELTSNVNSLRKQVSRLEMKTLGGPACNTFDYQPEILLDFDASLAREGLPISTCVELNEFEINLRQDSKYREKIVSSSLFICLSLFILLVCVNVNLMII